MQQVFTISPQGIHIAVEYAINNIYKKTSLETTLLIIYHQQHVLAL